MRSGDGTLMTGFSNSPGRRNFVRLMAGASLAVAGAMIAGCGNLQADPKRPRPKTRITGHGGATGKAR